MERPAGDRRRDVRFEIVGRLAGSLEMVETLPIVNLSRRGVCVRSARPLLMKSTSAARLVLDEQVFEFHVRVRHVHVAEAGEAGNGYLLGLEFIGVAPRALDEIERSQVDRLAASHSAPSDPPS
jgi:hypothetical protein